jgi:carboxymethylenebutenolidase
MSDSPVPHPEGFLAEPVSGKGHGVLVLHPWWGLNADTQAFCGRLADAGFVAFAPDLFHGQTATTISEAEALVDAYSSRRAEIEAQMQEAVGFLVERTGEATVAVVGFSFGAYYALALSNADPARVRFVVVFYGTGHEEFDQSEATYLGHFAADDDFEPKEAVDALARLLEKAGRPATIHTYPETGHWFFEPSVPQAFDKAAADLAWERTLAFLKAR